MSCEFYESPPSAGKTPAYAMSEQCRCRGVAARRVVGAVYPYTGRVQRSAAVYNANIVSILYWKFCSVEGVEYGLVHAISAGTGRVRRQFESCGYRRQYSKSACAPLCRRCLWR